MFPWQLSTDSSKTPSSPSDVFDREMYGNHQVDSLVPSRGDILWQLSHLCAQLSLNIISMSYPQQNVSMVILVPHCVPTIRSIYLASFPKLKGVCHIKIWGVEFGLVLQGGLHSYPNISANQLTLHNKNLYKAGLTLLQISQVSTAGCIFQVYKAEQVVSQSNLVIAFD